MGAPRYPRQVLLFGGLLYADAAIWQRAECLLQAEFGPILLETLPRQWHSDYYSEELALPSMKNINRQFIFFDELVDPGGIAEIKLAANRIESGLSLDGKRKVNIDPGYITPAKLVLASTKDYSHRVYLGKGIYGEATLLWSAKERTFVPHLYTYSDFRDVENIRVFAEMRDTLLRRLTGPGATPQHFKINSGAHVSD